MTQFTVGFIMGACGTLVVWALQILARTATGMPDAQKSVRRCDK